MSIAYKNEVRMAILSIINIFYIAGQSLIFGNLVVRVLFCFDSLRMPSIQAARHFKFIKLSK